MDKNAENAGVDASTSVTQRAKQHADLISQLFRGDHNRQPPCPCGLAAHRTSRRNLWLHRSDLHAAPTGLCSHVPQHSSFKEIEKIYLRTQIRICNILWTHMVKAENLYMTIPHGRINSRRKTGRPCRRWTDDVMEWIRNSKRQRHMKNFAIKRHSL